MLRILIRFPLGRLIPRGVLSLAGVLLLFFASTTRAADPAATESTGSTAEKKKTTVPEGKAAGGGKATPQGDASGKNPVSVFGAAAGSMDVLRMGDSISVIYSDIPSPPAASTQQIREDGKITLHLNYTVVAAGKTRGDLEREIRDLYVIREKVYRDITIAIQTATRFVSVGGEVRTPGALPHNGDLTVLKVINAAGGFTDFAKKTSVVVTRASDKSQITVNCNRALKDPSRDLPVFPGDVVFVKKSIW